MAEQSVTLNPGESKVVGFEAVPSVAKTYHVEVNGLAGSFVAVPAPQFYWLMPTGYSDPENRWDNEDCAIDGWTDTFAETGKVVSPQSWSPPIELTIEPTEISAVRYQLSYPVSPKTIHVDGFYDGAWHVIYEGGNHSGFNVREIPGGPQIVSKARIMMWNPSRSVTVAVKLHEFQFFCVADGPQAPRDPCPGSATTKLYGQVTNKVTGEPVTNVIGTVYQDYRTHSWDYDFTTDEQGYFLIDNMQFEVDKTQMVIYADGYQDYTNVNIPISEGDNELNVQMSPG